MLTISYAAFAQSNSGLRSVTGLPLSSTEDANASRVFIVQLQGPSAGEYHAATTRPAGGQAKAGAAINRDSRLQKNSANIRAYTAKLEGEQQVVLASLGAATQTIYSYKYGLNGFAARMSIAQAEKLKSRPDVLNVWEDEIRPLATTDSPTFLGLFDANEGLRAALNLSGDGIVIGVIDSGIEPDHPSLLDIREADRPRLCEGEWAEATFLGRWLCGRYDRLDDVVLFDEVSDWNGECETGESFTVDDCNNKLIGARWFIDGAANSGPIDSSEFRSPRDADGHGTHTATTAAGNSSNASIFGTSLGNVVGIAPGARVATYKACWIRPGATRAACNASDLANAIDSAVADGVDIISYSVGSSMREITAPDDVALMAAAKAGVLTVVAAGNEGPNLATIGSPAGGPWVITAAASSREGSSSVEAALEISSPPGIARQYATKEALFSPPLADSDPIEASLILVDDDDDTLPDGNVGVSSDGCQALVNDADVDGNIALMQRSGCTFTDMVRNAENAGAIAAIVYNIAGDPVAMAGDDNIVDIPALMIGQADANLILAELDAGSEISVTLNKEFLLTSADTGNEMASFSARGPAPVPDVLKPDVTAPGINILAGFSTEPANALPGEQFAYLSGTSMSTPHIAGVAALLLEAHPDWSPAAIKSAIMTTARRDVSVAGGLATANPFDFGAGHIDANKAIDPGLVYDVSNDDYDAFACGIASPAVAQQRCDELTAAGYSLDAVDLNQPSIAVARLANSRTVSRTVTNVSDAAESYSVSVAAPPGILINVSPTSVSIGPGESTSFEVTFTYESGPLDLWRFGSLTWSNDMHSVYSAIAVKPTAITAPFEVFGSGANGALSFPVEFGYNGSFTNGVHGLDLPRIDNGFVSDDASKTFTFRNGNGVFQHGFMVDPNQLLVRFSLFDAFTDGNDDLDMYVFFCQPDGSNCARIGESGNPTSNEQFNIIRPAPGVYAVLVHGFDTDPLVNGGAGSNYQLYSWSLDEFSNAGNITANGPATVTAGSIDDVDVTWSSLIANSIYLGAISHITPQGLVALTIVTISN